MHPTLELLSQQSQLAVDAAAPKIARLVTTHGLSEGARKWMENAAYDATSRENQTLKYIRADNEVYTRKENRRIEEVKVMLGLFKMKGLMKSETFDRKLSAFEAKPEFFHNSEKGDFYGHMEYQVRADAADYVGFLMDPLGKHYNIMEGMERILERSSHSLVGFFRRSAPVAGILPREWVHETIWKRLGYSKAEYIVASWPTKHTSILDNNPTVIRAFGQQVWLISQINPGTVRVKFAYHINMNGDLPSWITHSLVPERQISKRLSSVVYVQHVKPSDQLDAIDGRNMGEIMMMESLEARKKGGWRSRYQLLCEAVDKFCDKNAGVRAVTMHSGGWFKVMLKEVCWNQVYPVARVSTILKDLTMDDGKRIGRAYKMTVLSNTSVEAAADEFIHFYPALGEMDRQYVWFRPMMVTLAKLVLKQSKFGLYYRAILGASLSTMDLISDMYIISVFFAEGKNSYAYANIAMITMNWFFQLLIVWAQTGRNILGSAFLKETLITTLGLKPGLDAWRACNGKEKQPGQIFDAITEVRYMRLRGKINPKV